jgi:hypothetical protein
MDFDGDRDYVILPTVQFDGRPPWTIETIVRPVAIDQVDGFTSLVSTAERGGISLETKNKKWVMDLYTARISPWNSPAASFLQENYSGAAASRAIELGRWQHLAGVWDGEELRFYLDGTLQERRPGVEKCTRISHGPFYLGAEPAWLTFPTFSQGNLHGRMRAARISRAAEYDESFARKESLENTPGTIGLYDFTRDSGKIAIDWSGHGNHGIIVGAKFADENTSP